jgi:hypothetical protein
MNFPRASLLAASIAIGCSNAPEPAARTADASTEDTRVDDVEPTETVDAVVEETDAVTPETPIDANVAACVATEDLVAIEDHACIHARSGPFAEVTAAAPGAPAPDVNRAHTTYRIALDGKSVGRVRYAATRRADYLFFFDGDVELSIRKADGQIVELACAGGSFGSCTEIVSVSRAALDAEGVELWITPRTAQAKVSLTIERSSS